MKKMKLQKLNQENYYQYEAFLKKFDYTLIYHSEPFLKTLIKTFGFEQETIILKKIIRLNTVLPLLSIKGELGLFLIHYLFLEVMAEYIQ